MAQKKKTKQAHWLTDRFKRHPAMGVVVTLLVLFMIWGTIVEPFFEYQALSAHSFEECIAMGFPLISDFPEQCETPEGRVFLKSHENVVCDSDAECGEPGYFCKLGLCTPFLPEILCRVDGDCQLINQEEYFACCGGDTCETPNYADPAWIAVNKIWFFKNHQLVCSLVPECGEKQTCATPQVGAGYQAQCVQGACMKVSITP